VKYAVLIYDDESSWADLPQEERTRLRQESLPEWYALFEELGRADPQVTGFELRPRAEARVVRVRDGGTMVSDGPFAETKETIGGLFSIELADLDEAIRLAALIPAARTGSIEIRPIVS
jgi:hypothetical protein